MEVKQQLPKSQTVVG